MRGRTAVGVAAGLAAVTVFAVALARYDAPARLGGAASDELVPAGEAPTVPELTGITGWHNVPPTTLAALRGQVVLVDFWTYTCINCRRNVPFLRALHRTYRAAGLTIIGVHSPEFDFEKSPANIERAIKELDIPYAVAEDPHMDTWDAFRNQYWPASYLVDRAGRVRLTHIGEGGEDRLEEAVRTLLDDGGSAGAARVGRLALEERPPMLVDQATPELYLGAQRGRDYLAAGTIDPDAVVTRADAGDRRNVVYLRGRFRGASDWVTSAGPGATVDLRYRARDVYALLAPEPGEGPVVVEVRLDGRPVPLARRGKDLVAKDGRTVVTVDDDDLRHLLTGPAVADGRVTLVAAGAGARFVTFTFGG